jgi:hypothetical protein
MNTKYYIDSSGNAYGEGYGYGYRYYPGSCYEAGNSYYYEYDLYNWEENPKYIHLELVQLIESLEKSSTIYSDIVEYGKY